MRSLVNAAYVACLAKTGRMVNSGMVNLGIVLHINKLTLPLLPGK